MNNIEDSVLYIVATPIGNLEDITYRAVNVLSQVDIILAEDTRVSAKLLSGLNIKKQQKILSCHDFNEESRVQQVREALNNQKSVALISDAGTPLISDPGYKLVSQLRKENYKIIPIPGVSAIVTALSAAGLPSDSFMFKGFLSAKKAKRIQQLGEIKQLNTTVVIYESVHRILYLLEDLINILPQASIVVAKELTKQFEKFITGTPCQIYDFFKNNPDIIKGEFVVLINCSADKQHSENIAIDLDEILKELLNELPLKKAVALAVKITGAKKNIIYDRALEIKKTINIVN